MVRVTVAAVIAYGLATAVGLAQGSWAVLTAIIVMQASLGHRYRRRSTRFDEPLEVFRSAIDATRRDHVTHELPIEDGEAVFALGFALEQSRQDVHEAADRISERPTAGASGWNPFKS
jgi:hypothetical protein